MTGIHHFKNKVEPLNKMLFLWERDLQKYAQKEGANQAFIDINTYRWNTVEQFRNDVYSIISDLEEYRQEVTKKETELNPTNFKNLGQMLQKAGFTYSEFLAFMGNYSDMRSNMELVRDLTKARMAKFQK